MVEKVAVESRLTRDNYALFAFGFSMKSYKEAEDLIDLHPDLMLEIQGIKSYYDWSDDDSIVKAFVYWPGTALSVGIRSGSLIESTDKLEVPKTAQVVTFKDKVYEPKFQLMMW